MKYESTYGEERGALSQVGQSGPQRYRLILLASSTECKAGECNAEQRQRTRLWDSGRSRFNNEPLDSGGAAQQLALR